MKSLTLRRFFLFLLSLLVMLSIAYLAGACGDANETMVIVCTVAGLVTGSMTGISFFIGRVRLGKSLGVTYRRAEHPVRFFLGLGIYTMITLLWFAAACYFLRQWIHGDSAEASYSDRQTVSQDAFMGK